MQQNQQRQPNRAERRKFKLRMKQPYLMANLVYGALYTNLFLENQLKSLLDPTNVPALAQTYDLEYCIYTDEETFQDLVRHPNFIALNQYCTTTVVKMEWTPDTDRFNARYHVLRDIFHAALDRALKKEQWLSVWVADLVFAKEALPRMLKRLEAGHDAVFNVPIRSAADAVNPTLHKLPGAPTDLELFEVAYRNLHHLWTHSTWDNPYFSRMPYSILWNSRTGLLAHNFGITPIVFKTSEALREVQGVIDADVPGFFKNPYWATDWTDAPVAGVEPLSNGHYPPFANHGASVEGIAEWALRGAGGYPTVLPGQADNLNKPLYYPSKQVFADADLAEKAQGIAEKIQYLTRSRADDKG